MDSQQRRDLVGRPDARMVLIGNFEVENHWAAGEIGLPRIAMAASRAIVNRMDEFTLLLAGPDDVVVLKSRPDDDYLSHLADLGLALPRVICTDSAGSTATITEDVLADSSVLRELSEQPADRTWIWPHGVSHLEERLAAVSGLPLAGVAAAVCKRVNGKTYSRTIVDQLGLRQPAGHACHDLDEFSDAVDWARDRLGAGVTVVVKDAYGVSGKGIAVVRDEQRLDRLHQTVRGMAGRAGTRRVALVVEEWVAKAADLNYQFTVAFDGSVRVDFVREAITRDGVHLGHRIPARLTEGQVAQLHDTATLVGRRLFKDGYRGLVGVDAIVQPDGRLHPVIEINARNNMSTYQERLRQALVAPDRAALAMAYDVRPSRPVTFAELRDVLGDLLMTAPGGAGLMVINFATVNAGQDGSGRPAAGRLYGVVIADDTARAEAVDVEVRRRLAGSALTAATASADR